MSLRASCIIAIMLVVNILSGCAATDTAITKHNLTVQSKMSDPIFLEPVSDKERTVYVDVKNTSDYQNFSLKEDITKNLTSKGYQVSNSVDKSHYLLQVDIRQIGKGTPDAAQKALASGYGGAISGAIVGVTAAAVATPDHVAEGGLIGGAAGFLANSLVKDVAYTVVTDVQLSERGKKGEVIKQQQNTQLSQGYTTQVKETSNTITQWHKYRTRVVSTADQMNLSFDKAEPALETNLSNTIAGLF